MKTCLSLLLVLFLSLGQLKLQAAEFSACMTEQCQNYFKKFKLTSRHFDASFILGDMYYFGFGTPKDVNKAIRQYKRAAKQGSKLASYRVAVLLLMDDDTENDNRGLRYLRSAAKRGHVESMFKLALIYLNGDFGTQDLDRADKWLSYAYASNHPEIGGVIQKINTNASFQLADYPKLNQLLLSQSEKPVMIKDKHKPIEEYASITDFLDARLARVHRVLTASRVTGSNHQPGQSLGANRKATYGHSRDKY